jgi:hypothetical protein
MAQGADPPPFPLRLAKVRINHLNVEIELKEYCTEHLLLTCTVFSQSEYGQ